MSFLIFGKRPRLDKNSANLERMCGKITLMLQKKPPLKIENDFKGLLSIIEAATPCTALDVKRVEYRILIKLEEVQKLLSDGGSNSKILGLTGDIALLLTERGAKCEKCAKKTDNPS